MANRFISPSLADLDQDIAGVIPVEMILRWSLSKKDSKTHARLLKPYLVKGSVVSSDSSGLSKMSKSKTLFEVMKLVSQPKEVIFKHGSAIGGKAIGIWAADNTEIFYPSEVSPDDILRQMIAAQKEVNMLAVHIGLGIHTGEFIQLGGGLFGLDADVVEELAENNTDAGEIAVTRAFKKELSSELEGILEDKKLENLPDLEGEYFSAKYESLPVKGKTSEKHDYPAPFTADFLDLLQASDATPKTQSVYDQYTHEKIVILIKIAHEEKELLLDELSEWVLANIILKKITVLAGIQEIKSNGSLGIFVTDSATQAVEFACDLKDTLEANGFIANVGLSAGEVLIFPLGNGMTEIAGEPVNIASKLAEDSGEKGKVLLENSVKTDGVKLPDHKKFIKNLSHVDLEGVEW